MHLLFHPEWPLIMIFAKARKNRGIDFPKMPQDIKALAVIIVMPCVSCESLIHPIRERKPRRTNDRRQAHIGAVFYSGTCCSKVNPGCSRTSAASADIDLMLAAIEGV